MARVLVVDDNEEFLAVLEEAIRSGGHETVTAGTGAEALRKFQPDISIVVTDILMPERDGLEVILSLRKTAPATRIIAISSGGSIGAETVQKSAELFGADRFFRKPIDFKELLAAIDELQATP